MDDQTIKLVLQVAGQDGVDRLRKSTENYKALLEQLTASFAKGDIAADEYEKQARQLSAELQRQTALLGQLDAAHAGGSTSLNRLADSTGRATNKMAGLGQAGLQAGRAIQDFAQGGIGGILNNIEGLVMSLGGGAGLAGTLTAVGIAAFLMKDKLKEAFGDFTKTAVGQAQDRVEALTGKIEELKKKDVKLAVDYEQIKLAEKEVSRIKEALETIERLKKAQAEPEAESGKAVAKILQEQSPGGQAAVVSNLVAGVTDVRTRGSVELAANRSLQASIPAEIERLRKQADHATSPEDVAALQSQMLAKMKQLEDVRKAEPLILRNITQEAAAAVGDVIKNATTGVGVVQSKAQAQLVGMLNARGFGGLGAEIAEKSPANIQADRAEEADFNQRAARRAAAKRQLDEESAILDDQVRESAQAAHKNVHVKQAAADKLVRENDRETRKDFRERANESVSAINEGTALDEVAAAKAAQMRLQGGDVDRFGRFRKMNDVQQMAALMQMIGREIRRNPESRGMSDTMVREIATKMATQANERVDNMALQAGMRGANNTQALIGIAQGLTAEAQQLMAVQEQQRGQINMLGAALRDLSVRNRNRRNVGR